MAGLAAAGFGGGVAGVNLAAEGFGGEQGVEIAAGGGGLAVVLLGSGGIAVGGQAAGEPVLPGGVGAQGVGHGFDDALQLTPAAEAQSAAGIPFPVFFA